MADELCGQPTRSGAPCQSKAGHGTDHVGTGACHMHDGSRTKSATERDPAGRVTASSGTSDPVSAVLRDRAVLLEVQGIRTADIASELGVSASTVRSWRQTPEYKTARRELLHELFAAGTNVALQQRASRARVLDGIVHDTEEATANRIRAAAVLDAMERHGFDMTVTREELDEVRDALGLDD